MVVSLDRTLKYQLPMMRGADVIAVQNRLLALGFGRKSDVDGLFGPGTRKRVIGFQTARSLSPNGVVDNALYTLMAPKAAPVPTAFAVADTSTRLVPDAWMPAADMRRIVMHWTAGTHTPSALDKKHYHILIDGDGKLHRGNHSITDNVPPLSSGGYAAHTLGSNSHSIGVSCCAMLNANERPFRAGAFPLTIEQWRALAQLCAELCLRYSIPISRKTVLGHGEVQDILGIKQRAKWDPMVLPWDTGRPFRDVGDELRAMAEAAQAALLHPVAAAENAETPPAEPVTVNGTVIEGMRNDGRVWVDLAMFAPLAKWSEPVVNDGVAEISTPALRMAVMTLTDANGAARDWIDVTEASQNASMQITEDAQGNITLRSVAAAGDGQSRQVTVQNGQTLGQIALRWLGDRNRWRELTDMDGNLFTESSARRLRVGQIVRLPETPAGPTPAAFVAAPAQGTVPDDAIARIGRAIAAKAPSFVGTSGRATMDKAAQAILKACNTFNVTDPTYAAYILATANHETNLGRMMMEKWGPTAFQRGYVGRLGNKTMVDAKQYRGRGFVQITGKSNYEKYSTLLGQDFTSNPDVLLEFDVAAIVIVRGMAEFGFTRAGFVLSDLGGDEDFDYVRARSLINGDKDRVGDSRYPGKSIGRGVADTALIYREIILAA